MKYIGMIKTNNKKSKFVAFDTMKEAIDFLQCQYYSDIKKVSDVIHTSMEPGFYQDGYIYAGNQATKYRVVEVSEGLRTEFPDGQIKKNLENLPNEKFSTAMFGKNHLYPEYQENLSADKSIYDICALSVASGILDCRTESELNIANILIQAFTGKTIKAIIEETKSMQNGEN